MTHDLVKVLFFVIEASKAVVRN